MFYTKEAVMVTDMHSFLFRTCSAGCVLWLCRLLINFRWR